MPSPHQGQGTCCVCVPMHDILISHIMMSCGEPHCCGLDHFKIAQAATAKTRSVSIHFLDWGQECLVRLLRRCGQFCSDHGKHVYQRQELPPASQAGKWVGSPGLAVMAGTSLPGSRQVCVPGSRHSHQLPEPSFESRGGAPRLAEPCLQECLYSPLPASVLRGTQFCARRILHSG